MVEFTTIVGSKGQVVIPKPLSEEHGLILGKRVVIKETEGKITLERPNFDVVAFLNALPKKKVIYSRDESYEDQPRQRFKKAGINL